ncbi:MAG: hypothetical protein OXN18_09540 [Gemmatimonadota bacterium]|nr:hypothetical protein [Gemmatimonadota bacterium]
MVAALAALAATACRNEPGHVATPEPLSLFPAAASPAPLSVSKSIALGDEETACVVDSFEFRVVCVRPEGEEVVVFGREGDGPGEFRRLSLVARVSHGRLGVVDATLNRLTIFDATGDRVSEVAFPTMYYPDGIRQATLFGSEVDLAAYSLGDSILTRIYSELDINSGEITWTRGDMNGIADTECGGLDKGVPRPGGGYVFWACRRELVFLDDRDADAATLVTSPAYREEPPSERDVEAFSEGLTRLGGRMAMPRSATEPYVETFREEPKRWFNVPGALRFDSQDRLWVAITVDRDTFSYFEIWIGNEYAGSVRVRDRAMGFDLFQNTLAVLVERQPGPEGIAARGIDWYDISDLDCRPSGTERGCSQRPRSEGTAAP